MSNETAARFEAYGAATVSARDDLEAAGVDPDVDPHDDAVAWLTAQHGELAAQERALFGAPLMGDDDLHATLETAVEHGREGGDQRDVLEPLGELFVERRDAVETTLTDPTEGRRKAHELARRVDGLGNDPPRYIADGSGDDRSRGVFTGDGGE